jgi:peptidoglycan-associated lipoprotein
MMRSNWKTLVRLVLVLAIIGGMTTNCAWLRRMRQTPRKHWYEFWKPKKPKVDIFPPSDLDVTPPPPPPVFDDTGLGAPDTVPIGDTSPEPTEITDVGIPETTPARVPTVGMVNELETVYFDFDQANLRADARRTLDANAQFLLQHPDIRVQIEGHCDERGTMEYNLHLGQRRADTVREYMISKGIPPDQLEAISYGEERPIDPGHTEAAWSKNRRVQFLIY